jgi:hypothetical protein
MILLALAPRSNVTTTESRGSQLDNWNTPFLLTTRPALSRGDGKTTNTTIN